MAKPSRRKIVDQQLQLYRIHCECVRRNPEYKKDFEQCERMANAPPLRRELARRELAWKWGVLPDDCPNPKERPPLKEALSQGVVSGNAILRAMAWRNVDSRVQRAIDAFLTTFAHREVDARDVAGMLMLMYFPEENREHPSYTAFNMRWTKKELMESWEHFVDACLRDRANAGLKQEVPDARMHLDQYARYLQAYDLRKKKLTYAEIDRQVWPNLIHDAKRGYAYYRKGEALVLHPPWLLQRVKHKRNAVSARSYRGPSQPE